jgi:hypothetical protein
LIVRGCSAVFYEGVTNSSNSSAGSRLTSVAVSVAANADLVALPGFGVLAILADMEPE